MQKRVVEDDISVAERSRDRIQASSSGMLFSIISKIKIRMGVGRGIKDVILPTPPHLRQILYEQEVFTRFI